MGRRCPAISDHLNSNLHEGVGEGRGWVPGGIGAGEGR